MCSSSTRCWEWFTSRSNAASRARAAPERRAPTCQGGCAGSEARGGVARGEISTANWGTATASSSAEGTGCGASTKGAKSVDSAIAPRCRSGALTAAAAEGAPASGTPALHAQSALACLSFRISPAVDCAAWVVWHAFHARLSFGPWKIRLPYGARAACIAHHASVLSELSSAHEQPSRSRCRASRRFSRSRYLFLACLGVYTTRPRSAAPFPWSLRGTRRSERAPRCMRHGAGRWRVAASVSRRRRRVAASISHRRRRRVAASVGHGRWHAPEDHIRHPICDRRPRTTISRLRGALLLGLRVA